MIPSKIGSDRLLRPAALGLALTLGAGVSLRATSAHAEGGQGRAMAEALFRQGKKLLDQGKIDEACEKLESSYRIDEALGTLLNLATCHEKQGKLATAWGEFNEALMVAKKAGQAQRQAFATEHATKIEPRLAHLTITVPPASVLEGLEITLDRVALARGAWGTPIPVDPGAHEVAASAPAHRRWVSALPPTKEAGSGMVIVPKLEAEVAPVAAPPPPPPPRSKWKLAAGLGIGGAGVASLAVGAYFGAQALHFAGEANQGCTAAGACTASALSSFESGKSAATGSNLFFAVGGVFAAAGGALLLLYALESPTRPATARLQFAPVVAPGAAALTAGGSF